MPMATCFKLACPVRLELTTSWFVAMRSIQLGYGQILPGLETGVFRILPQGWESAFFCNGVFREGFNGCQVLMGGQLLGIK